MKVHEYQAKQILGSHGVAVPKGRVAFSADDARAATVELGGRAVVKAQIHAGGRGKAGGVKLARDGDDARAIAAGLLGKTLVTIQTGPEGREVKKVLVEETLEIATELYLGVLLDRGREAVVVIASPDGGVEIEKVAAETPDRILTEAVPPGSGLPGFSARRLAFALVQKGKLDPKVALPLAAFIQSAVKVYLETDASLVEINPLAITKDGRVLALDAKMTFDDNALYRHPEVKEMRDLDEEAPLEVRASKYGLNYIKLDGNVGCMVNGAGLAMATMDIIKLAGGSPANFLDVGGGANAEQVSHAFEILLADPAVKAVLINIFGGIMRCDVLASGVVEAARRMAIGVPVVVRLEGTNVEEGQRILKESGLTFTVATSMEDAAEKVVRLSGVA
ncbi:MAG: ADP-forming succinate--CoA ligase subunit beta [Acidobacteriota bacterium]